MAPNSARRDIVPRRLGPRLGRHAGALGLVALALGCSHPHRDPLANASRSVSSQRIDACGRWLSADAMAGRYYASPEADSTAAYILARLTKLGAPIVQRSENLLGPHAASFAHHFSVTLYRLGAHTRLLSRQGRYERGADLGRDFVPLVYSRPADVVGKVTWVRRRLDTLRGAEAASLRDRIAVVDWSVMGTVPGGATDAALYRALRQLEELGATAVLFRDAGELLQLSSATYPSLLPPPLAAAAQSPRGVLLNLHADRLSLVAQARAWQAAPRRTLPAAVVRAAWLDRLQTGDEVALGVELVPEVSLGENVLVGFRGANRPDEVLVLGANYDHSGINAAGEVLNGANDNASGVAALLEVAEALAPLAGQLQRSVLLAFFSAEKPGQQGSATFLEDLPRLLPSARPVAMLCLRAVGRNGQRPLLVVGGSDHTLLAAVLDKHDQPAVLLDAPFALQRLPDDVAAAAAMPLDPAVARASDHLSFARAGIPSLLVNDGLDPALYGQPDDDWKSVDADKVARVARLVLHFAFDLATDLRPTALPASSPH